MFDSNILVPTSEHSKEFKKFATFSNALYVTWLKLAAVFIFPSRTWFWLEIFQNLLGLNFGSALDSHPQKFLLRYLRSLQHTVDNRCKLFILNFSFFLNYIILSKDILLQSIIIKPHSFYFVLVNLKWIQNAWSG